MNIQNRNYTILSLGLLAVAVVVVGSYAYLSRPQVSADIKTSQQTEFYSLKKGWNYFTAGNQIINADSRIISINGSLISLDKARERGIVGEISLIKDDKIIARNVEMVTAGGSFAVYVEDIGQNPQIYLGE